MEYTKTHPWITFQLRLPSDGHLFWLQLGEAASKCEHLAGAPLRPDVAAELHEVFLAKGVLATTAIEGNTLSEEQVRQQIRGELHLPKSQEYLQQEVQNILDLCNNEVKLQLDPTTNQKPSLCLDLIRQYNRIVLRGLATDDDVVPGEIRKHSVVVGNVYRGAPPSECEYLLEELCKWLNGDAFEAPSRDLLIPFALIKAVVAHVYLAWIHPFGDGNGRTARMVEFHLLFASGVPTPAAHLLSDHYNKTRTAYYRELAKASQSGGNLMPFIQYALQGFVDGIREQIERVRTEQRLVAWENYVHSLFRQKKNSPTQKRRRDLVLELTKHEWIEVKKIELLTPNLAQEYREAGDRMLQRDLNGIATMGLLSRKHGKVRANKELIQAFIPARVRDKAMQRTV